MNQNKQRVLVVDDEPLVIALLARALQAFVEVLSAETGAQALEIARSTPSPDLILLDVGLPDLSGHEVCYQLKSHPNTAEIPVIFTTARDLTEDETSGFELGAVDYITKPLNIPVTLARVRAHLETRRLHHEIKQQKLHLDLLVQQRTQALEKEMRTRREAEKRFIYRASHDDLTGLPNMSLLRSTLSHRSRTSPGSSFALCLLMLNDFQEINNSLGHQHGNELLRLLSRNLSQESMLIKGAINVEEAGEVAYLCRLDGVLFALMIDCPIDAEAAITEVSKLLRILSKPMEYMGMSISVSGSIGLAVSPSHGTDLDTLLRRAQVAEEQALQNQPCIALYCEDMDPRRMSLMDELKNAIEDDKLKLYYQVQLDLETLKISSMEALLRWQHPKLGFIPPDEVIPLAEQTGLIKPLTAWVLNEAIKQCVEIEQNGYKLDISVNLSARNLREADLAESVLATLETHGLAAERLILEVTETALLENPQTTLRVLHKLDQAGVKISIDDFGTGYSSFGQLRNLPVQEIKIDCSFVIEMMNKHDDRILVKTVIDMASNLGLRVVAEGVEQVSTLKTLRDLNCDVVQGNHLSRPIPPCDLLDWLKQFKAKKYV